MIDLKKMQELQKQWQNKNFPNAKSYQCLLGVSEEVGELNHAHLKTEQGIRGDKEKLTAEAKDSIGDIIIFLAGYCNMNGYDLESCIRDSWNVVSKRDWTKNKIDGVSK